MLELIKNTRYVREMGITVLSGPNLSKRLRGKYVYPYLLRGLKIDRRIRYGL